MNGVMIKIQCGLIPLQWYLLLMRIEKRLTFVPLRPRIYEACHSLRDPDLTIVAYPLFRTKPLLPFYR
jgi:hypothetical protein